MVPSNDIWYYYLRMALARSLQHPSSSMVQETQTWDGPINE